MRSTFVFALLAGSCMELALGHSWIACTDYAEKNAAYYDHNKCRGYARSALRLAPKTGTFGQDRGYNYHPSETQPCRDSRDDRTEYDNNHPMAVYYPGQQVVLAHPMKNHGSDVCTNPFVPDSENFIYRGEKNAMSDPTLTTFRTKLVADLGKKDSTKPYDVYPKSGYQNAPAFCENTDKSLGTYSFNVPKDLQPGLYTFIWVWGFNSDKDLYSTCFEVNIVGTLAERNENLLAKGFADTYEPCGGVTSKFDIIGNANPGCTGEGGSATSTSSTATVSTTPPPSPTTTSSTMAPGQASTTVFTLEQRGEILLPLAKFGVTKRTIEVRWQCAVTVNYWGATVAREDGFPRGGVQHQLVQYGFELRDGKIFYHAIFSEPCDVKTPPSATVISDEK